MGLETGDYIDDLVATNPIGGTDNISEGDDHIRLLKKTIKQTFPNITGPVTLTQAQINALPEEDQDETISGTWDFTGSPTVDSIEIGYLNMPVVEDNDARTVLASDVGKVVHKASGTDATYTITNGDFSIGDVITFYNSTNSDLTITLSGATLRQDASGTTGSVLLGPYGRVVAHKVTASLWAAAVVGQI